MFFIHVYYVYIYIYVSIYIYICVYASMGHNLIHQQFLQAGDAIKTQEAKMQERSPSGVALVCHMHLYIHTYIRLVTIENWVLGPRFRVQTHAKRLIVGNTLGLSNSELLA